ncbi:MAG: pyridoxal phosphate-dependent aminotransferase [Chloroflexota bacterium]
MRFAQRVHHLKAEGAYHVLARAQALEAEGRNIIHLEIGEPDFNTAPHIINAAMTAIQKGLTRYNPPSGILELREIIAGQANKQRGLEVRADNIVISPGAKPNLFFPTLCLVGPGDEVLYPDPGFPTYEAMIQVAGGVPVPVPLLEDKDFSFDLETLEGLLTERTKLIVLNSPSNPTGGVIPREDCERIAELAIRHNCWVLSDEIYSRLTYDGLTAPSIAALPGMADRTIIVDGFSKTYCMTGWRLGFGIMPRELAQQVQLMLTHSIGCTAHFTQYAGIEALTGPQSWVDDMVREYQKRRDLLVEGLNELPGVRCKKPQGAFYAFPNIRASGKTSEELANLILEKAGVALLPGTAFGSRGEGYLRLSYANSQENIREALQRMAEVLRQM